ncbi:MAG: hypothetical protein AAF674_22510 [Pseudomonadota bacterium]
MKSIFLGPWLHWLFLLIVVGGGYVLGLDKLHVSNFNPFLILLTIATVVLLVLVLISSKPGDRITRDPIEDDQEPEAD